MSFVSLWLKQRTLQIGFTRHSGLAPSDRPLPIRRGVSPLLSESPPPAVAMHLKKIFSSPFCCSPCPDATRSTTASVRNLTFSTGSIRRPRPRFAKAGWKSVTRRTWFISVALGKPDKIAGSTWYYKLCFEEGDGPFYVKRYEKDFTIPFADGKVTDGLWVTLNGRLGFSEPISGNDRHPGEEGIRATRPAQPCPSRLVRRSFTERIKILCT